jgi:BirA family biotin operon repressor/biotin-[acetyl-CoA-carboxylase] ligase
VSARDLLLALATDAPQPGPALAARLGVTRAAVWKQIEQLRAQGAPIVAVGKRGYRLDGPLDLLDAEAIRLAMSPAARALAGPIAVSWQIDSTNTALLREAAAGAPTGPILLAEFQSAGRGRRGRSWVAPLASSICLSVLWRCDGLARLEGLSVAVGLALARACAALGMHGAQVKWPNDLVVDDAKLAGVLVEAGGEWNGAAHVVVGIGINWRLPAVLRAAIDQASTDLAAALMPLPPRNAVVARVLDELLPLLDATAREGAPAQLGDYARHDALAGRSVDVVDGTQRWAGTALGINARGELLVRDGAGHTHALRAAEVSVRGR